jgi:hypothetical protein
MDKVQKLGGFNCKVPLPKPDTIALLKAFTNYLFVYKSFLFTNKCTSDCLKNNIKIYITIAPTCFGAVTPSSGSSLSVLA